MDSEVTAATPQVERVVYDKRTGIVRLYREDGPVHEIVTAQPWGERLADFLGVPFEVITWGAISE